MANTGCPADQKKEPRLVFNTASQKTVSVDVELAITPQQQARGLMYRKKLKANNGMLFIYPAEDNLTFWMKNTYVPLDLIYIGANHRVVGIVQNTTPLSLKQIKIDALSKYVLEVNAGFTAKHGIFEGTRVDFEGIDKSHL
jgi:uncharacterized membrane protein (UPF0127 family)